MCEGAKRLSISKHPNEIEIQYNPAAGSVTTYSNMMPNGSTKTVIIAEGEIEAHERQLPRTAK